MPAESLTILGPFPKMDPHMDTDVSDSEDLASLLAEASLDCPGLEQSSTHSSCPVNLNDDTKGEEHLTDSIVWPPQGPWSRDSELPLSNAIRLIPFQADHSVSIIEESEKSPPALRQPTSRYKTELCRTFQESGFCKYGSKCQFAHGTMELRGLSRHPKYKTELCRTYHTAGFCPYGFRCHFIHNAEEQRFNSNRLPRPPLLRQSISCSGIPSLSSSGSPFSSSHGSSLNSLPTFSPTSPSSPISNMFASVGSEFSTPSPVTVGLPLYGLVSPPRSTVQKPWAGGHQMQPSPWGRQGKTKMADKWDSLLQHEGMEESTSVCSNSQEVKRLPIFSFLSD